MDFITGGLSDTKELRRLSIPAKRLREKKSPTMQTIIRKQFEAGKMLVAICHGVGRLLNVKLSNGEYLIKGRKITGFNWFEKSLARRKKEVPFISKQG